MPSPVSLEGAEPRFLPSLLHRRFSLDLVRVAWRVPEAVEDNIPSTTLQEHAYLFVSIGKWAVGSGA